MNGDEQEPDAPVAVPRLFGLLVTYQRPTELAVHLDALTNQTRQLDHLVVVDNAPEPSHEQIVQGTIAAGATEYLGMADNLGPAGAISRGMQRIVELADSDDWIVLLDDDDPPRREDLFEGLTRFAVEQLAKHQNLGMIGMTGARFDSRRGRLIRLADEELHGAVPVDYVAGGQLPLVRVAAVEAIGGFTEALFFGFDDLDFGLRLQRNGFAVLVDGSLALWARTNAGRLGGGFGGPRLAETSVPWRRYYSLRNLIYIARIAGHWPAALWVTTTSGIAKPALLVFRLGRDGFPYLTLSIKALVDGWLGRLGRRVEPGSGKALPSKE